MLSSAPLQLLLRRWIKISWTESGDVQQQSHQQSLYYFQLLCVGQLQFFALILVYFLEFFSVGAQLLKA